MTPPWSGNRAGICDLVVKSSTLEDLDAREAGIEERSCTVLSTPWTMQNASLSGGRLIGRSVGDK
jgi:hypothetical protein